MSGPAEADASTVETEYVIAALRATSGNISMAARIARIANTYGDCSSERAGVYVVGRVRTNEQLQT
jgi:hypothetical protein